MKMILKAAAAVIFVGSAASAATLDFTGAEFASSFDGAAVSVTVEGVNFTITPTARGAAGFRQGTGGLLFGIPGNGMNSITVTADADLT